ncbi:MAG: DNA cytosine methyltransferase [Gammaproteobacteria bacterium]
MRKVVWHPRLTDMKRRRSKPSPVAGAVAATAVDLFCGAGGLTRGLLDAGISVAAGYDVDAACQFPYEHNNPGAEFKKVSVTDLTGQQLATHYPAGYTRILVGCAPCQTFSKYTQGLDNDHDPKWKLLDAFARLVRELQPDIVSMENVPELQRHSIFDRFLDTLASPRIARSRWSIAPTMAFRNTVAGSFSSPHASAPSNSSGRRTRQRGSAKSATP